MMRCIDSRNLRCPVVTLISIGNQAEVPLLRAPRCEILYMHLIMFILIKNNANHYSRPDTMLIKHHSIYLAFVSRIPKLVKNTAVSTSLTGAQQKIKSNMILWATWILLHAKEYVWKMRMKVCGRYSFKSVKKRCYVLFFLIIWWDPEFAFIVKLDCSE